MVHSEHSLPQAIVVAALPVMVVVTMALLMASVKDRQTKTAHTEAAKTPVLALRN